MCLESDVSPAICIRFPVFVCCLDSDVSPAIGIRFSVCVFCLESDVRPAIGSLFPLCISFDVSASLRVFCFGVRYPNYDNSDSHSR